MDKDLHGKQPQWKMPLIAGNSQNKAYLDFKQLKICEKSEIQL